MAQLIPSRLCRKLLCGIIACGLIPIPAHAALDMWLKIEGVDGESQAKDRKGEIDVLAWSWGGSNSGTTHLGGGGGAGKATVQDISVTKYVDSSSPDLLRAVFTGRMYPTVWLDIVTTNGSRIERFALRNTIVTSVSTGGSGGEDRLTENVTFNFAKVEKGYLLRDEIGSEPRYSTTTTFDAQRNEANSYSGLPVRTDRNRNRIDDFVDHDKDNNGIADPLEEVPVAPSPARAGIQGVAFIEVDGAGQRQQRDGDEPAAVGTRVELYLEGSDVPLLVRTVNEVTGRYAFLNLDPATYRLRFVPKPGYQIGAGSADPGTGFSDPTAALADEIIDRDAAILADAAAYSAFAYVHFADAGDDLIFRGEGALVEDAGTQTSIVQLTPGFPQVSGSVFTADSVVAANFSTHFRFRMRGSGLQGDGFAFVVNGFTGTPGDNSPLLGGLGGQLGYGGIPNSFAVEFDTLSNGAPDPSESHVGILIDGNVVNESGATAVTSGLGAINDGAVWNAWIDYDGATLQVRLARGPIRPLVPIVSRAIEFSNHFLTPQARVGFTAATFSARQTHEILSWEYEGGEDNTFIIEAATPQAELDAVTKTSGAVVVEETSRSGLTMSQLTTINGNLIIRNNSALRNIDFPKLVEVFGDVIIEGNPVLSVLNLPKLRTISGDVRITTDATVNADLSQVLSENVSIIGVALEKVNGKTGYGETRVEIGDNGSQMVMEIPEGAFTVPESFAVQQLNLVALEKFDAGAIDAKGSPVNVAPVLGFEYSFAGGGLNLNREVTLRFEINLNALSAAARRNLVDSFDRGALTVFGSRFADGPIEVFTLCDALDFGVWDNCAQVRALDRSGGKPVNSSAAQVLEFSVYARHFSTYGIAMISPIAISETAIQDAASKVGSSLQIAVNTGAGTSTTHTLSWTSFSVASSADGAQIHPAYAIQTSGDLETWVGTGAPQALQLLEAAEDSRSVTITVEDGEPEAFYRVALTAE